jgi:hypothetical protein
MSAAIGYKNIFEIKEFNISGIDTLTLFVSFSLHTELC